MYQYFWVALFFITLIWSGIYPKDYLTWALEVFPAVFGFVILMLSYRRYKLTTLLYVLILMHSIILMVGGHYTYAEVPLFDYLSELFESERNNYDKLGHFAQGLVPAIIAREILIRNLVVNGRYWMNFFIVCICLALSAFYEMIEWWVALLSQEAGDSFLGTQGYIWDTQSDMAWALCGAILALIILSDYHDKQLRKLCRKN